METRDILEQLCKGKITIDEAELHLKQQPYEEMGGFAKLDTHRKVRAGFPEVVFCEGKANEHLLAIYERMYEKEHCVFGTRASQAQYEFMQTHIPQIAYDPISRILKLTDAKQPVKLTGSVAVCTAGTADIPVAEEAAQTCEYFGSRVERIYDVGVAGLHRLLTNMEPVYHANCVIAVAGMEGALASVLGGLVDRPVIAVPTSVGYGASFHGLSALLTMINSCANGVGVVNIDNGYGAAYLATQINRLGVRTDEG